MSEEIAALVVRLEARVAAYEKNVEKARRKTNRELGQINRTVKGASRNFDSLASSARRLVAGFTAYKVIQYADSFKTLQNNIRQVATETDSVSDITNNLFGVAQRSRTSLQAIGATYRDVTVATDGMGLSTERVQRIVETLAKGAPGATGAIRQLGQGLAAGALRGEELTSVLEGAPRLARAIADEFGVGIGQLKKLGEEGALVTGRVIKAIEDFQTKADALIQKQELTVGQALTKLDNAFTVFIGGQDSALGATDRLAGGLALLADNLDTVSDAFVVLGTVIVGRYLSASVTPALIGTANLVRGVDALGASASRSAVAMRGLSGAMAFFGGPVGLAITAVTLGVLALASGTDEATSAQDKLRNAVTSVQDVMIELDATEDKLQTSKEDLTEAEEDYQKALRQSGEDAQDSARLQVDAINQVIAADEVRRKEQIRGLRASLADAKNARQELLTSAVRIVATSPAGAGFADGTRAERRASRASRLAAFDEANPDASALERRNAAIPPVSEKDYGGARDAFVKEIDARLDAGKALRDDQKEFLKLGDVIRSSSATIKDLDEAIEARLNFGVRATFKPTPPGTPDPVDSDGKKSKKKTDAERLAEALAEAQEDLTRAQEKSAAVADALGGYESERARTARDVLETREAELEVQYAGEDAAKKARDLSGSDAQIAELSRLAEARTKAQQEYSAGLDLLSEQEKAAADLNTERDNDEKEYFKNRASRIKRLDKFMEKAHKAQLKRAEERAEFDTLVADLDQELELEKKRTVAAVLGAEAENKLADAELAVEVATRLKNEATEREIVLTEQATQKIDRVAAALVKQRRATIDAREAKDEADRAAVKSTKEAENASKRYADANQRVLDSVFDLAEGVEDLEGGLRKLGLELLRLVTNGALDRLNGTGKAGSGGFFGSVGASIVDAFTGGTVPSTTRPGNLSAGPVSSGGGLGSMFSSLLGAIGSWDGGGDTYDGPRRGGLDGKGGFLGLLHPKERVDDLTKPGFGRQAPVLVQEGDISIFTRDRETTAKRMRPSRATQSRDIRRLTGGGPY